MTVTLLPAVDVAGGRAVRPARGSADTATVHGDPLEVALALQRDGAEWIHLVDLDAAFGRGSNAEVLARIIGELDVDVQLSGGITDAESLTRALATGCARVNIGTQALSDRPWCSRVIAEHGERIAISLDVAAVHHHDDPAPPDPSERLDPSDRRDRHDPPDRRDRRDRGDNPGDDGAAIASGGPRGSDGSLSPVGWRLAPRGSTDDGRGLGDLWDSIDRLDRAGCARYVITDVSRDGMLDGPAIELYRSVLDATRTPVVASGGISTIADLEVLARAVGDHGSHATRLDGAVVGTALHAGRFTLAEARTAVRRVSDVRAR